MKIGILDSVLGGKEKRIIWEALYQIAGKLGFEGLELGVKAGYEQTQLWKKGGRERLLKASRKNEVLTPSICLHSYWLYSFASPDKKIRIRAQTIAKEAALAAAEMQAKNILVPLTCPEGVEDTVARKRWREGIASCAVAAESQGVFFCLENVGQSFARQPQDIINIVDAINSPAVKVYYDPGNAVIGGLDPLKGISLLGRRIRQIHVKEHQGTYLGDGIVPWPKIIEHLQEIDYDGWLVLETNCTEDPRRAAKKNLERLEKII